MTLSKPFEKQPKWPILVKTEIVADFRTLSDKMSHGRNLINLKRMIVVSASFKLEVASFG
jgi:hypothetical protein